MQDYGIVTCSRHLNLTDFEVGASCSIALQGKAKTGYPLQVQILHTYRVIVFCKAVAEIMLEILPLVLYLFMI